MTGSLERALTALSAALQAVPAPSMLIGGIAVITRGVPRLTRDIDATVQGGVLSLDELCRILAAHGITPRVPDALSFAETSQVLLLRHAESGVDIDVSIAWLPFELEALLRAESLTLAGGATVKIAQAEDLVVYKCVAWRPQDQQDVERLLTLHGATMDLDRLRRRVAELAEAMEESERLAAFEAVVERVLGHPGSV